jgi:hypothetical protein
MFICQSNLNHAIFLFLKILSNRFKFWHVIVLGISLMGGTYFASGYGKLFNVSPSAFQWISDNHTVYLMAGAYKSYHWLGFLPEDTFMTLLQLVDQVDVLLNIFTLIAEIGIIFSLIYSRRVTIFFLTCIVLFHTGVFFTTGLLFRMWMLPIMAFIVFLIAQPQESQVLQMIYRLPIGVFALFIMTTSLFLPQSASYAWWDIGIFYNLDYDVTTIDGERYELPRSFLLPYEEFNKGNGQRYIDMISPSTNNIGAGSYNFWESIDGMDNPDDIAHGVLENGTNFYDSQNYEKLEDLIRTSVINFNQRGLTKDFLPFLPKIPPHYLFMFNPEAQYYTGQAPIKTVHISYRIDFYDRENNQFYLIEDKEVYSIPIPLESEENTD